MQNRPVYVDNRAQSATSKGIVQVRHIGATGYSPLLPAGAGYGQSLVKDLGDFFTGKTARKEAAAYKKRQEDAVKEAELALIAASGQGTEVAAPGLLQWGLLLAVVAGVGFALTR